MSDDNVVSIGSRRKERPRPRPVEPSYERTDPYLNGYTVWGIFNGQMLSQSLSIGIDAKDSRDVFPAVVNKLTNHDGFKFAVVTGAKFKAVI